MVRLFQNFDIYPQYLRRLHRITESSDHTVFLRKFQEDRFIALHMLLPTLERREEACFAIGNDRISQQSWARAKGMPKSATKEMILRAQIEEHRTEVFYNHDPLGFSSDFVRSLPGCVRRAVAWRAAPSPGADFAAYDRVVCNFPSILQSYRDRGWNAAWFAPAFDPVMDDFDRGDRRVDILFVGSHTQYHRRRAELIERLSQMRVRHDVVLHLQLSRMTLLADTPLGWIGPLRRHRLSPQVRIARKAPVYGRDLYEALGRAKIVVNCAIDMAGSDRGNMRCWETLGSGALMLSDTGNYPDGMVPGATIATYATPDEMVAKADALLGDEAERSRIAAAGKAMIRTRYSKERQWADFLTLI